MKRASRQEYTRRVNRVVDHVRRHLADDLSLATLARLAAFSPFHFHRIFRAVTGEPVFGFIQRLRIEKAAVALLHDGERSVRWRAPDASCSCSSAWGWPSWPSCGATVGHAFTRCVRCCRPSTCSC